MRTAVTAWLVAAALTAPAVARAADGALAAPPPPASASRSPPRADALARRYRAARVRRTIGWGLAGAGIAAISAGAVVISYVYTQVNTNPSDPGAYDRAIAELLGGAATVAAGIALAIPGLVLSLQGQQEMTNVQWRLDAARRSAFVVPARGGALVGVRVAF